MKTLQRAMLGLVAGLTLVIAPAAAVAVTDAPTTAVLADKKWAT